MTRNAALSRQLESARESRDAWEKKYDALKTSREDDVAAHNEFLESAIYALGIRDAYPDVTTTKTEYRMTYGYGNNSYGHQTAWQEKYEYEHTDFGRDRFKADVLEAASAKKASKAVKRLAAAIKAAK